VAVYDAAGQPLSGAEVSALLAMPAMPSMNHPAMRSESTLRDAGNGVYRGSVQIMMAGRWDVTVTVTRDGRIAGSREFSLVAR
jgi:nitrogen fixation protein FixH